MNDTDEHDNEQVAIMLFFRSPLSSLKLLLVQLPILKQHLQGRQRNIFDELGVALDRL